jgi:uncharacterized protein YkwD
VRRRISAIQGFELALMLGAALMAGCPNAAGVGGSPVAGVAETSFVVPQTTDGVCLTPANSHELAREVLDLVNEERTNRGLNALTLNPLLSQIAEDFACEMIEDGFFAHENPNEPGVGPGQRAIDAGYIFLAIGENLAGGQTSPVQVMREWMASTQGHRENILSPQWSEIGIAVRTGGEYGVYWVQEFGNPP